MCEECGQPSRVLWTFGQHPGFDEVSVGNWAALVRCRECGSLWVESPYEPYASFTFYARWPLDEKAWHELQKIEKGLPILEWHSMMIREKWQELPIEDRNHVERWRDRTYRQYNPIDGSGYTWTLVRKSADLQRVLVDARERGQ
jgi:hypothetical protein